MLPNSRDPKIVLLNPAVRQQLRCIAGHDQVPRLQHLGSRSGRVSCVDTGVRGLDALVVGAEHEIHALRAVAFWRDRSLSLALWSPLQPRVDRLGLECEDGEDQLVDFPQRFTTDEGVDRVHA